MVSVFPVLQTASPYVVPLLYDRLLYTIFFFSGKKNKDKKNKDKSKKDKKSKSEKKWELKDESLF